MVLIQYQNNWGVGWDFKVVKNCINLKLLYNPLSKCSLMRVIWAMAVLLGASSKKAKSMFWFFTLEVFFVDIGDFSECFWFADGDVFAL